MCWSHSWVPSVFFFYFRDIFEKLCNFYLFVFFLCQFFHVLNCWICAVFVNIWKGVVLSLKWLCNFCCKSVEKKGENAMVVFRLWRTVTGKRWGHTMGLGGKCTEKLFSNSTRNLLLYLTKVLNESDTKHIP